MGEILFLAHRVPFPPNRGDKIRSANLLRKLSTLAPVHAGCFAESDDDRAGAEELATHCATSCIVNRAKPLVLAGAEAVLSGKPVSLTAFHSQKLERWIRETIATRPISTIVIFSGQMGQYVPNDFSGRVVIDLCDVDSAKFESYAKGGQRAWINAREGRLLAREEERLATLADEIILISENEASLFRSRLDHPERASIRVIGNGIDAEFFDPEKVDPHPDLDPASGPHFVFTGQMDYAPNIAAVEWTARAFMPRIRESFASARFHIVGRAPTRQVQSLDGANGVKVWGEVPDVRPYLAGATCVLAPLQIARGVQNKVLEAMAMARPVMLTPEAATGIAAQDAKHWLLAKADADAISAKINALIADPAYAQSIGCAARQFVQTYHAWDAMLAPIEELVGMGEARDAA